MDDDDSILQPNDDIEAVDRHLDEFTPDASDEAHSHESSSLTPTLCSDLTAVDGGDEGSEVFSDAGSKSLSCNFNSTTPSQICSLSVNLGQEYLSTARRLLMAKIRCRYGVLFPYWVCECTTVPRGSTERKPHPSQYYPLREQREEWRDWQQTNPRENDPGGEISLNEIEWDTESPDDKPPFYLWYLILAVIHGSPMKRLTEHEIKLCLIRRFYYYAFRQFSHWDCGDDWLVNVSNELEQNDLFTKLNICKKNRDDSNCYWTISRLPLDVNFHPRNQILDNTSSQSVRSTQDMQDHPVDVDRAPTLADDNSFKPGPPKIPISMLVHPATCNPLNPETIEITAQDIELWCWLPS